MYWWRNGCVNVYRSYKVRIKENGQGLLKSFANRKLKTAKFAVSQLATNRIELPGDFI